MNDFTMPKIYACPMHLEIVSDKPGRCPKCGMDFALKESKPVARAASKRPHPASAALEAALPIKDFLPIIVIFSSIVFFTAIALFIQGSWSTTFAMRMMMGSFFLIFSSFKVFNLNAFADGYSTYDILAKRSRAYAFIYPFIELALAILYLANFGGIYRDIFTFVLMTVSSIGVIQKIRKKEVIPCACLGMVFKIPMTWVTLIEDLLMAMEAFFMAVMALGLPLAYSDTTAILFQALKTHTPAELAYYSELGHWIFGGFIIIALLGSIFEQLNVRWRIVFTKYLAPIAFILPGFGLSIVDVVLHSIYNDPHAVWYLLTHISQLQQHFLIGIFFLVAGIAEWIRTRGDKRWLAYVVPFVIFLIGTLFFFHQQLGVVASIKDSMNRHMLLGAMLVIGAVFRVLDILFFEEKKSFFIIWIVAILIGAGMLITHREPEGAYQLPSNIIQNL